MNEYVIHVSLLDPVTGEVSTATKRIKIDQGDNLLQVNVEMDSILEESDRGRLEHRSVVKRVISAL